ncbi:putative E3 ubiquitin-protein ligase TRIML1 [Phascolarctos cinereus]
MASLPEMIENFQEELICSIFRDYLENPMSIECGHSKCETHQKVQKLFCDDDRSPIHMSCSESNKHKAHTLHCIDEAAEDFRSCFTLLRLECEAVDITLDRDTADPGIIISADLKRMRYGHAQAEVPNNTGRFSDFAQVLDTQSFISSRCYWAVDVPDNTGWSLKTLQHDIVMYPEGESMCAMHREDRKLFCESEETLLCLTCSKSEDHGDHFHWPIAIAALRYRKRIEAQLEILHRNVKKVQNLLLKEKEQPLAWAVVCIDVAETLERNFVHPNLETFDLTLDTSYVTVVTEFLKVFQMNSTLNSNTAALGLIISEDLKNVRYEGVQEEVPNNTQHNLDSQVHKKYHQISVPNLKVGIFLDYEHGEISFYHVKERYLIYTSPSTSFSGLLTPFFCLSKQVLTHDCSLTICP